MINDLGIILKELEKSPHPSERILYQYARTGSFSFHVEEGSYRELGSSLEARFDDRREEVAEDISAPAHRSISV